MTNQVVRSALAVLAVCALAGLLSGCPAAVPTGSGQVPAPGSPSGNQLRLAFWHTRRGQQEELLRTLCREYEQQNPGVTLEPEYQGNYNDLQKKIRAALSAKALPALAVGYEPQISEYAANGAVRPLDDLVADPEIGLSPEDRSDIPEQILASNRFRQFDNQLLSFPFTKSTLLLYFNRSLLSRAGFTKPPETWAQLEAQAAAVTKQIGSPAVAFDVDPSTLDGMILAHGGELLAPDLGRTRFDEPPAVETFALLQRMARAKTLQEYDGDDVPAVFAAQRCAFGFATSASLAYTEAQVGSKFDWDVAVLPLAPGVKPVTVLYGPNVCIFKGAPDQERAAWKFIRYFVSPEVTARWARETGYLPVRQSVLERPGMQEYYAKNPRALHALQTLPVARPEPNVIGWQEVRGYLEEAARAAIGTGADPQAVAVELKRKADRALAQSRR